MATLCKHDALRLFDVAIEVQSRIKTMNETTQSTSSDEMQIRPKKPSPRIHTPYPWDEVTKVTESSTMLSQHQKHVQNFRNLKNIFLSTSSSDSNNKNENSKISSSDDSVFKSNSKSQQNHDFF